MSDALSKFIGGLQTLDPTNLGSAANQDALRQFQSLPGNTQRDVLNGLAASVGSTFEELHSLPEADKKRVGDNVAAGRNAFDGVTRQQQTQTPAQQPVQKSPAQQQRDPNAPDTRTFEQKWAAAAQNTRGENYHPSNDPSFAERYGDDAASNRHGHQNPERQAQLARIASIQSEAKSTGKSFSEVADARVAAGQ